MKLRNKIRTITAGLLAGCLCFASFPMVAGAVRSIREIQEEQENLQKELDALDSELVDLLTEIAELETEIAENEAAIATTEQELVLAQEAVDKQYADMKVRIRYMYENGNQNIMSVLLESGSISDFLNRVEYMNSVYTYDREKLDNFQAIRGEIEEMKIALEEEREDLRIAQSSLDARQTELNVMIAEKEGEMDDVEEELAKAKEAAARQAELERQAAAAAAGAGGSGSSAKTSSASSSGVNGNLNPAGGVDGAAVVAYAKQFVGCPYVWGGYQDPAQGVDCSGFVCYVYRHFGYDFGRLTSYGWRSVGQEVSYNNLQQGDIVCYAGHVGIYAGGGVIVEAQDTAHGVTCNRSVNCHSIITIRRL